jgi:hypothetical protein
MLNDNWQPNRSTASAGAEQLGFSDVGAGRNDGAPCLLAVDERRHRRRKRSASHLRHHTGQRLEAGCPICAEWVPSAPSPPPRNPTQDQRWLAQEQGHVVEGADWFSEYEPSVQAYLDSPNTLQELQQAVSAPKPGYDIHHIVEKTSAEQDGFPKLMINGSENLVRIPRFKHREITGGLYDEE